MVKSKKKKRTRNSPIVLAVDNDPNIPKIISLFLKGEGYEVEVAHDVDDALQKIEQLAPDLVLLEVMMKKLNGYEFCALLQNNPETAEIPIIFVTALGKEQNKALAFRSGASDLIEKPFKKENLVEKVRRQLKLKYDWDKVTEVMATQVLRKVEIHDFLGFKIFLSDQLDLQEENREHLINSMPHKIYDIGLDLGIESSYIAQLIAEYIKVPYIKALNPNTIKFGVLPPKFCLSNHVVPLEGLSKNTVFAIANPFDLQIQDILHSLDLDKKKHKIMITEPENFAVVSADDKKSREDELDDEIEEIDLAATPEISEPETSEIEVDKLVEMASKTPIVKMANLLLSDCINSGASDLHIDPRQNSVGIRYRLDGMLHERESIPKFMGPSLVSRFKIMANIDIANRRLPQDGRIKIVFKGRNLDLRISTLPAHYGEKVVIRIIDDSLISMDFESLGFEGDSLHLIERGISRPYGIILATGPTGSGKTTTLYTVLMTLNDPNKNIITVEDPIENTIHRITQVQI
ncbi:ATPase, T2SS/T4P/T4SS family, partial [candidate division CSSED10-310 bacterium]